MSIPKHFRMAMSTIKDVSYDNSNHVYMTDSELPVYNFDTIKDWYASELAVDENKLDVKSNDALYITSDSILFIEFKNGNIDKGNEKAALKRKIYDSYIILFDEITNAKDVVLGFRSSLGFMLKHADYILVYNGEKNPSSKKNVIRHGYLEKGNIDIKPRFGLSIFEGYLFRKVRTYTEEEFQKNFVERVCGGEKYI